MILDQKSETLTIEGHEFNIVHIKTCFTYNDKNNIVFCAVNRDVETYPLEDYIGTNSLIDKDGDRFFYSVYISSRYLDEFVNTTRTSFDLPNKSNLSKFTEGKLSIEKIIKEILIKTDSYLKECLEKLNDEKQKMMNEFVSNNPDFRYILSHYNKEIYEEITVNYTSEKLNALFYKYKGLLEYETKKRAEEFINLNTKTQKITYKELREKYEHITEDLTYVNSADLVKYMLWRKLIIQALEKKIQLTENDDYETEAIIHDLVFPRGNTTDQLPYENINLWIIDEKLEYHKLAVSDLKTKKYSTSTDNSRADILICVDGEENKPATSVAIIEFKRPMRNHYDRDPIQQMYDYIEDIRDKKLNSSNGRMIQFNSSTRFNCYLICDINKEIDGYANGKNFIKVNDGTGYYGHNHYYNAYTEIMSFDEVLDGVKKRHKRFFEKLGIPQQI